MAVAKMLANGLCAVLPLCMRTERRHSQPIVYLPFLVGYSHSLTHSLTHLTSPHLTSPHLTSPHPTPLHSTPLHSTPLHSTPLHSTPLHSTPLHSTPLHSTPLHSTPLHSTPLHSTPLHSTPLHSLTHSLHLLTPLTHSTHSLTHTHLLPPLLLILVHHIITYTTRLSTTASYTFSPHTSFLTFHLTTPSPM